MLGHPDGLVQIAGSIRRNAARFGDKIAYIAGSTRLSWQAVDAASDRLAWRLRDLGIGRRDHVAIFGNNSPNFIIATYALFKLGATAIILNASLKSRALAAQLNHAEAKAVIAGESLQPAVNAIRDTISAKLLVTWDAEDRSEGVINLTQALRDPCPPFPIEAVADDDIACIVFSSGTTGTPKGAINSYWNVLAKTMSLGFSQELTANDVGLLVTPLCMGGTQFMSINPYILLGMTAVIMPSFDAGEMLRVIESERVTTMFCVPTMINAMVRQPDFATRDLSSLKRIISAGASLPLEIYNRIRARGIGLLECYGTSESGGGIMISADEKAANPNSVGRPMVGFDVRIVDSADQPLPVGEIGEIVMRGDPIARGYYKQPDIEAEIFANGWFHTGDLGRWDEAGYLYLADRKKDMVKTGGMNVYPKEIEEFLYELPGLVECAVVGLPHAHWGEAVTAFIVRQADSDLDAELVLASLKENLSNYQIPKAVVFVDSLPKTAFGKLSKVDLRRNYADYYSKQETR
jgi:acyl-CoA synthetase (AMP-forming)/AMP-acid ligase II